MATYMNPGRMDAVLLGSIARAILECQDAHELHRCHPVLEEDRLCGGWELYRKLAVRVLGRVSADSGDSGGRRHREGTAGGRVGC